MPPLRGLGERSCPDAHAHAFSRSNSGLSGRHVDAMRRDLPDLSGCLIRGLPEQLRKALYRALASFADPSAHTSGAHAAGAHATGAHTGADSDAWRVQRSNRCLQWRLRCLQRHVRDPEGERLRPVLGGGPYIGYLLPQRQWKRLSAMLVSIS